MLLGCVWNCDFSNIICAFKRNRKTLGVCDYNLKTASFKNMENTTISRSMLGDAYLTTHDFKSKSRFCITNILAR